MTNTTRGDATLASGGKSLVMRLTLGALAEIEDGLGVGSMGDIADRLKNLATKDIAVVASALLKGGGMDVSTSDVLKLETDVGTLVGAISGAFDAAGVSAAPAAAAATPATAPVTAPLAGTPSSSSASA
jgi:hypothetical protein